MTVYADKRADFHRHSRSLEIKFLKLRALLKNSPNVIKRIAARKELEFLLIEVSSLRFGAQIVDLSAMVNKLESVYLEIQIAHIDNEAAIESLAHRFRRSAAERLARETETHITKIKTFKTPAKKGVTLIGDQTSPVFFVSFIDVNTEDFQHPVYTVWNTDKAISSSFTPTPHEYLDWRAIGPKLTSASAINAVLREDGFKI